MSHTTLPVSAEPIFGLISFGGGVFCVPADAAAARAAFRRLRIRPGHELTCNVDAFGITPGCLDRGTPAVVFGITHSAVMRLFAAGLIDRERAVGHED